MEIVLLNNVALYIMHLAIEKLSDKILSDNNFARYMNYSSSRFPLKHRTVGT